MYGSLGTRSMVYQNEGGGLHVLPLWSASVGSPVRPQWIDDLGNFRLFDEFLEEYIPLSGSDQVYGSIIPRDNPNTISLGSPTNRYYNIYGVNITASGFNGTLFDTSSLAKRGGFAYFDANQQLVSGGDLYDLSGWTIESQSIDDRFKDHTHYITQSILVGSTPALGTDSTGMFLQGSNGIDARPEWAYIIPDYIRSNATPSALNGPGVLVVQNTATTSSWITSSVPDATHSRVVGIQKNSTTISFFDVIDLIDGIIPVQKGGTGLSANTKGSLLVGKGGTDEQMYLLSPNATAGLLLLSKGTNQYPEYGTASVQAGGTGLNSNTKGSILLGKGGTDTQMDQLVPGNSGLLLVSKGSNNNPVYGTASVMAGGTGLTSIAKGTFLLGSDSTQKMDQLAPGTAGLLVVSNGSGNNPSYGTASVMAGGTGLNSVVAGDILYGSAANKYGKLPIGSTNFILKSNGTQPTWSPLYSLEITGTASIGKYNPTSSYTTINITPANIGAATQIHSHSANDIVSGQLSIARIPTGTSYDTVALGNHTHEDLNITIGSVTYTYNGGVETNIVIDSSSLVDALGIVPVQKGGTGLSANTKGSLLVGNGGTTTSMSLIEAVAAGKPLVSKGVTTIPAYETLGTVGGGTGITAYTKGDILYASSTGATSLSTLSTTGATTGYAIVLASNGLPAWSQSVLSSSYALSASFSTTSSYALKALTSSYADNAKTSETASYAPSYIPLAGTTQLQGNIVPNANNYNLGSSTYKFANVYATNFVGTASLAKNANTASYAPNYIPLSGTTDVNGNIIPATNSKVDLGSSTYAYKNIYATTFHGDLVGTASNATNADTASYAPDYIPLAGTDSLTGDIIPTSGSSVNLGSSANKYNYIYATTVSAYLAGTASRAVTASRALTASRTAAALTYSSSLSNVPYNSTFNGSSAVTIKNNDGTLQVDAVTAGGTTTATVPNNDYYNHTILLTNITSNSTITQSTVTLNSTVTNYVIGSKITIKAISVNKNYQYYVNTGSANMAVYNRDGTRTGLTGSYGMDIVLTCFATTSTAASWSCEKIPVTFI